MRRAIGVVLRETWAHNRYMERDLDAPAGSGTSGLTG
jgi:hypothetical protein